MIWNHQYEFAMVDMSDQMVTGWLCYEQKKFLATFFYAKCNQNDRREL